MNQPYARVNQPYATLTLASGLREMFGVQLYKNNARALLSRILSILNLDWLQHARSVRGVYECLLKFETEDSAVAICQSTFQGENGPSIFEIHFCRNDIELIYILTYIITILTIVINFTYLICEC